MINLQQTGLRGFLWTLKDFPVTLIGSTLTLENLISFHLIYAIATLII